MAYRPTQVLTQEPAAVKTAVLAVLAALVFTNTIRLDGEAVAAWGIALETVLNLFYVRPLSVSRAGLAEVEAAQKPVRKPRQR